MTICALAWPWKVGGISTPALVEDEDAVTASLHGVLQTGVGERVMREVGTDSEAALFEPVDVVLSSTLRKIVLDALRTWEPRAEIRDVRVEVQGTTTVVWVTYLWAGRRRETSVTMPRGGVA